MVVNTEPESILKGVERLISKRGGWPNPYGDGHAAERIVDIIIKHMDDGAALSIPRRRSEW